MGIFAICVSREDAKKKKKGKMGKKLEESEDAAG